MKASAMQDKILAGLHSRPWARALLGLAVASFALIFARVAGAAPDQAGTSLRRFALIASSNDGGSTRVKLRFADSDARAMADVLEHLGGLKSSDLVLLTGANRATLQASFARMRTTIEQAPRMGRRELVIYYSGHSDETGLLLGGEKVTYQELRQWIDGTNADVRIAILDSCASGGLIRLRGGIRRPPFLSNVSAEARGHAFLTASSADEAAQESDRIGAAFFTHYLVSALRGAADSNRDGLVTLGEAYQFAYHETLQRTAKTAAGAQHPAYDIQLAGTGDLVLTDLRSTSATLMLEENLAGHVYVRNAAGRLVVELRKEPLYPIKLGLAPGSYRLSMESGGRYFDAAVALEEGHVSRVERRHFVLSGAQPATARGDAKPQESPHAFSAEPERDHSLLGRTSLIGQTREIGGYASLSFNYTELGRTDGFVADLEAALLLNRRFAIGFMAGGGISGSIDDEGNRLALGYGGVVARYFFLFDSPFAFSVGAAAMAGGVELEPPREEEEESSDGDALFIFEPLLGGHLNLTRFARIGVHAGYRFPAGVELYDSDEVRGLKAGFHAQLGWF
jgi:hypothetical protein